LSGSNGMKPQWAGIEWMLPKRTAARAL